MNVDISAINRHQSSLLLHQTAEKKVNKRTNHDSNQIGPLKPNKDNLNKIINKLNKMIQPHQTSLHFILYSKLHTYYVQIVDDQTKKVIKEIPPKKFLDMYYSMAKMNGLIINKKG